VCVYFVLKSHTFSHTRCLLGLVLVDHMHYTSYPSLEACSRIELRSVAGDTRAEANHEKTFHCDLPLIRDSKYDPSYCKVRRSVFPFSIFRCSLSPQLPLIISVFQSSFISSFLFQRKRE